MLVHEVFSVRDASQSLAEPLDCPDSPGARTCYDGNFSVFSAVRRLHALRARRAKLSRDSQPGSALRPATLRVLPSAGSGQSPRAAC